MIYQGQALCFAPLTNPIQTGKGAIKQNKEYSCQSYLAGFEIIFRAVDAPAVLIVTRYHFLSDFEQEKRRSLLNVRVRFYNIVALSMLPKSSSCSKDMVSKIFVYLFW